MRTCRQCGGSMEGRAKQARVCSTECRVKEFNSRTSTTLKKQRDAEGPRNCKRCGVSIDHRAQQAQFCSDLCLQRHNRSTSSAEINKRQAAVKSKNVQIALRLIQEAEELRLKSDDMENLAWEILDMNLGFPPVEIEDFLAGVFDD